MWNERKAADKKKLGLGVLSDLMEVPPSESVRELVSLMSGLSFGGEDGSSSSYHEEKTFGGWGQWSGSSGSGSGSGSGGNAGRMGVGLTEARGVEALKTAAIDTSAILLEHLLQNYSKKPIYNDSHIFSNMNQRNCVKIHNCTVEFSRSESEEVFSALLPEQTNAFIDDSLLSTEEAVKYDVSADKPIFDLLSRQKVVYAPPLCNSCFVDLEPNLYRKLREILLLSEISNGVYEPDVNLALFLRGDDNSGRPNNIFQIFKFFKSHSEQSKIAFPPTPTSTQTIEDLLLKANSVLRSFTQYRKFHFKGGEVESSLSPNEQSKQTGPLSTPVSAAVYKFDVGLDSQSNISKAELKCFLVDTRVLLGRVMKNDSNFLSFNIFYDLVNELSMVDEALFRTVGFFSMNRSYNSSQFDILNRPLSYYLQKLKSESDLENIRHASDPHSDFNLFSLAGVFSGTRLSDTFTNFMALGFSGEDIKVICKVLASILHLSNLDPNEAVSSVKKKIPKRKGSVPMPVADEKIEFSFLSSPFEKKKTDWQTKLGPINSGLISLNDIALMLEIDEQRFIDALLCSSSTLDNPSFLTEMEDASVNGDSVPDFQNILGKMNLNLKGGDTPEKNNFYKGEISDLSPEIFQQRVDTLLQWLYQRLLCWIVGKINAKLAKSSEVLNGVKSTSGGREGHMPMGNESPRSTTSYNVIRTLSIVDLPSARDCSLVNGSDHDLGSVYDLAINYLNDHMSISLTQNFLYSSMPALDDEPQHSHTEEYSKLVDKIMKASLQSWLGSAGDNLVSLDRQPDGLFDMLNRYSRLRFSGYHDELSFLIAAIEAEVRFSTPLLPPMSPLHLGGTSSPGGMNTPRKGLSSSGSYLGAGTPVFNLSQKKVTFGAEDASQTPSRARNRKKCAYCSSKGGFTVTHFQGEVKYSVKGFLSSNLDFGASVGTKFESILKAAVITTTTMPNPSSQEALVSPITNTTYNTSNDLRDFKKGGGGYSTDTLFSLDTFSRGFIASNGGDSKKVIEALLASATSSVTSTYTFAEGGESVGSGSDSMVARASSPCPWRPIEQDETLIEATQRVVQDLLALVNSSLVHSFINIAVNDPFSGEQPLNKPHDPIPFNADVVAKQLNCFQIPRLVSLLHFMFPVRIDIAQFYESLWQFRKFLRCKPATNCDKSDLHSYATCIAQCVFPVTSYFISDNFIHIDKDLEHYSTDAIVGLREICAIKLQRTHRMHVVQVPYRKLHRAVKLLQSRFRLNRWKRIVYLANEINKTVGERGYQLEQQQEGLSDDSNSVLDQYLITSLPSDFHEAKRLVNAVLKVRAALTTIVRNGALLYEIELLHRALESGDINILRGYLTSLSSDERRRILRTRDRRYLLRSVYHSAVIGGHLSSLIELNPSVDDLMLKDAEGNQLVHSMYTPNLKIIRYMHRRLQRDTLKSSLMYSRLTRESLFSPDDSFSGWLMKLNRYNQWQSRWFIIKDNCLRYYKASLSLSADGFEDEIVLSEENCFVEACLHAQEPKASPKPFSITIVMHKDRFSKSGRSVLNLYAQSKGDFYGWLEALGKCKGNIKSVVPNLDFSISGASGSSGGGGGVSSKSISSKQSLLSNSFVAATTTSYSYDNTNLTRLWVSSQNSFRQTPLHVLAYTDTSPSARQDRKKALSSSQRSKTKGDEQANPVGNAGEGTNAMEVDQEYDLILEMLACAAWLTSHGCPVDKQDVSDKSALAIALQNNNTELAGLLLERGADSANIVDPEHNKALDILKQKILNYQKLLKSFNGKKKDGEKVSDESSAVSMKNLIINGTYMSVYIDSVIATSKRQNFASFTSPYLVVKICDIAHNVLDQYISPYPSAYRNRSAIVFGFDLKLRPPLELLPEKFILEVQLKDFNPLNLAETSIAVGQVSINKLRLSIDDMKAVNLQDSARVNYRLVLDISLFRAEPPSLCTNVQDQAWSARLSTEYMESSGQANKGAMDMIPFTGARFGGLPVIRSLGLVDNSSSGWIWFVATAPFDIKEGEHVESLGGLAGVNIKPSVRLKLGQKFLCMVSIAEVELASSGVVVEQAVDFVKRDDNLTSNY